VLILCIIINLCDYCFTGAAALYTLKRWKSVCTCFGNYRHSALPCACEEPYNNICRSMLGKLTLNCLTSQNMSSAPDNEKITSTTQSDPSDIAWEALMRVFSSELANELTDARKRWSEIIRKRPLPPSTDSLLDEECQFVESYRDRGYPYSWFLIEALARILERPWEMISRRWLRTVRVTFTHSYAH